ncbi:mRpL4 [Bugula neritina]|uniref:Large ribosomal subunit protein uL4m n=1 Tax=Bugula neritina TaxID=10212 RepID=A0A7J7ITY2_BUGNE|nr:mRpL4 [Bugula neritina]
MAFLSKGVHSMWRSTKLLQTLLPQVSQSFLCSSSELSSSSNSESESSDSLESASHVIDTERIRNRKLLYPPQHSCDRIQSWVSTLSRLQDDKVGIIDLHPSIFGVHPRLDIIHENIKWQQKYKNIDFSRVRTRAEMPGGGRKPWRQKGTGRARHGSIRSPLWNKGGAAKGPRGPTSNFYMLPFGIRVLGLRTALSCKLAQNDLHIVDSLYIPAEDPEYLRDLVKSRAWGYSLLLVDDNDEVPQRLANALQQIPEYNVMPAYGLNVYSMLKHETVVLTLSAVEKIEERLLYHLHRSGCVQQKFRLPL